MSKLTYTTTATAGQDSTEHIYPMPDPECYIYLHHVETYIILPSFAEASNDSIQVKFNSTTPLMRSAPIYAYNNSGPRSLQVSFNFHRDMIKELNYSNSSGAALIEASKEEDGYIDYVDIMAKQIQAAALPKYTTASKMVNPPLVSLKLGNDLFIKGVVSGSVGVSYGLPVLDNGKYAQVAIQFGIDEVSPYDAETVMTYGSYRGVSTDLSRGNTYTTNKALKA